MAIMADQTGVYAVLTGLLYNLSRRKRGDFITCRLVT